MATTKSPIKPYKKGDKRKTAAEYRLMLKVEEPPAMTEQEGATPGESFEDLRPYPSVACPGSGADYFALSS